jgi:hypothetical protein
MQRNAHTVDLFTFLIRLPGLTRACIPTSRKCWTDQVEEDVMKQDGSCAACPPDSC